MDMKQISAALFCGLLFGGGLVFSGMVNPAKVIGFLDVAGEWDPTLIFVMGSALLTALVGYRFVLRKDKPLFDGSFRLPTKTEIDPKLVGGSAMFGIGWGLSGYCPGPAVVGLATGLTPMFAFVGAMLIGMVLHKVVIRS